jgi:hypothetical protein
MKRLMTLFLFIGLVVACAPSSSAEPGGGSQPSAAGGGGGSDLVSAAAALTDVCTVMPTDLVAEIVPDGEAPESEQFPPRCSVYGTSIVQITISAYDAVDPLDPAETVSGLGTAAYLQRADAQHGYVKVVLSPDAGAVYVEVVSDNERDPGDDAIAVARAVIASLQ